MPTAIVVTHAHSDHVDGLKAGAPCAVYATADVWRKIDAWPVSDRRLIDLHEALAIGGLALVPVPAQHSIRAPAIGYRETSRSWATRPLRVRSNGVPGPAPRAIFTHCGTAIVAGSDVWSARSEH